MKKSATLRYLVAPMALLELLFFFYPVHGGQCYIDSSRYPVTRYCPASNNNYLPRTRTAEQIDYIVIHTVQGSLESAVHTFSSSDLVYPRSAHYVIGKDGEVIKSVPARQIAWHAGTRSLGSGGKYENKVLNRNSIGIEHAGYVGSPNFPTDEQYVTSAALTRYLCELYGVPINRDHIVGHEEIKSSKGDPGPNWNWGYYMSLVRNGKTKSELKASSAGGPSGTGVSGIERFLPGLAMIGAGIALLSLVATGN